MKRSLQRTASLLLAVCLLLSVLPLSAAAAPAEPEYYGREALGQMSNGRNLVFAYDKIAEGIANRAENISLFRPTYSLLSPEEIQTVYYAFLYDHAEVYYLDNSYGFQHNQAEKVTAFIPQYISLNDDAALQTALDTLYAKSGVTDGMSDYEKALRLHDVLCAHVEYDYTLVADYIHTAYGALVNGLAVCDGYTKAYQLLLRKAGISSHEVVGDAGGGHAWNLVKLDGEYYYTDVTWDDQDTVYYAYFNATQAMMDEDHTLDVPAYGLPACTATAANYFTRNGGKFTLDTDPSTLLGAIEDNGMVRVYYTGDETATKNITDWLFDNAGVFADAIGITGGYRKSMTYMGREYHLTLIGNTPTPPAPDPEPTVVSPPAIPTDLVYTGEWQTGVETGDHYLVTGNATAVDAGEYQATLTLADNCEWEDGTTAPKTVTWRIAPATVTAADFTFAPIPDAVFEETPVLPAVSVTCKGQPLVQDVDYTLTYTDNTAPGTGRAWLTAVPDGNYTWEEEIFASFTILAPPSPILYGDADGDGSVTVSDALLLLSHIVGRITLDDAQALLGDVDGNGTIGVNDALYILQHITGRVTRFPVEE